MGLFVVTVRYSDGNTFGSSSGHGSIQAVFKTKTEADGYAKHLKDGGKPLNGKYPSWTGYFAGLEGVDVDLVPVL